MDFHGIPKPTNPATTTLTSSNQRGRVPVLTMLLGDMAGRLFRLDQPTITIGRLLECRIQLNGGGVSRNHARLNVSDQGVKVTDLNSTNGTFVNGERITSCTLSDGDKLQLGTLAVLRFNLQDELDQAFHRQQFEKMTRDPLTGCHNRLYFDEELQREGAFAKRKDTRLSVAMIDIDHFKRVNDTHGHSVGDAVLRRLTAIFYEQLRTYDVLGRYGGEEFVALLRDAELSGAQIVAERLRAAVARAPCEVDGIRIPVTISIGVASTLDVDGGDPHATLRLADRRLYAAKHTGRNRVVASGGHAARQQTEPVDHALARVAIAERRAADQSMPAAVQSPEHAAVEEQAPRNIATEDMIRARTDAHRRRSTRQAALATTMLKPVDVDAPPCHGEGDEGD